MKQRRLMSVMLILMMLFSSVVFSAYALEGIADENINDTSISNDNEVTDPDADTVNDEENTADEDADTEEEEILEKEEAVDNADEETLSETEALAVSSVSEEEPPVEVPEAVKEVKVIPSKESVWLEWDASEGAEKYVVKGSAIKDKTTTKTRIRIKKLDPYKSYTFKVYAVNSAGTSEAKVVKKAKPVRPARYVFTMRSGCKLTSHGGKKRTKSFKKGETIYANKFSGGQYVFDLDGSRYHCNRVRANSPKVEYTKKFEYSREAAEAFINDYGLTSKTKQLIWVNTYTQHAFYFKKKNGEWKCTKDWDCSTGKATSPTPTGTNYGRMSIWKKLSSRHGISWWSCFSSMNAMHGKRSSWNLGSPKSGGCIRNANKNAKWIFSNVKMNTKVIVY